MEALPNDLSQRHAPTTGMFAQPAGKEWARYRLSGEQLEFYRQTPLWYEYHANESTDPGTVLFHGLDDSTEENGCLQYVPDSHTWPLLPRTDLAGNMTAIMAVLTPAQKAMFRLRPVAMKRGHASFHHPLLVHGSHENRSDRERRAVVLNTAECGAWRIRRSRTI